MLSQFLVSELFAFLLIFCRLGTAMMLLPGFGEAYVAVRIRLMLALMFSMVMTAAMPSMPPPPATVAGLAGMIIAEIAVGIFMGGLSRMMIAAIHMASMIIAYQSSLASALTQDITQIQSQGTSLGNLLGVTALVMLFATNLHHVMLQGLADSYSLFTPGQFPPVNDFAQHASRMINGAFFMAMQLAAPHIVIGLIVYFASGIIARLMPNIQIFFIIMAPQILLSFIILMLSISAIMIWYMEYFKNTLGSFLAP